jgi:hypothetical protein
VALRSEALSEPGGHLGIVFCVSLVVSISSGFFDIFFIIVGVLSVLDARKLFSFERRERRIIFVFNRESPRRGGFSTSGWTMGLRELRETVLRPQQGWLLDHGRETKILGKTGEWGFGDLVVEGTQVESLGSV